MPHRKTVILPYTKTFSIHYKTLDFGRFAFDQHWMPIPTLRPTKTDNGNFSAIIAQYWKTCQNQQSTNDPGTRQTYLLARLLPWMRLQGAQRIVAGSFIGNHFPETYQASRTSALEGLLQGSIGSELTLEEFRDRTAQLLGPHDLSSDELSEYEAFTEELLNDGLSQWAFDADLTLEQLRVTWQEWMRVIGRRAGHEVQKKILDVLSYEACTAFRRCYSAVWAILIAWMQEQENWSPEQRKFHRLWHLDICECASTTTSARFHLFHGHIFGLHPAMGPFLKTPTGRQLVSDWLAVQTTAGEFQRLLFGLYIAVFQYTEDRANQGLGRRTRTRRLTDAAPDQLGESPNRRDADDLDDYQQQL